MFIRILERERFLVGLRIDDDYLRIVDRLMRNGVLAGGIMQDDAEVQYVVVLPQKGDIGGDVVERRVACPTLW